MLKRLLFSLVLAVLAGTLAPMPVQAAATCQPFSGFPLSVNLGSAPGGGDGESLRCFAMKMQAAFRTLGSPNGIAALDKDGRIIAGQMPLALAPTFVGMTSIGSVDTSLAGTYNPPAVMFGAGNRVSFCPELSCVRGPYDGSIVPSYFDHQRASVLISGPTQLGGQAQEQLLAVIGTAATGSVTAWQAGKAYAVGADVNRVNANETGAVYRARTAGVSGGNPPPAARPSALPFTFNDGGVTWEWINDPVLAAKASLYVEQKVKPGAGGTWGQATNVLLDQGLKPSFHVNTELDIGNNSGTDCGFGNGDCFNLFVRSGGSNMLTGNVQIESVPHGPPYAAYFGLRVTGPRTAKYADIVTDSSGAVGVGVCSSGTDVCSHSTASILDQSISPIGLQFRQGAPGTTMHSVATIVDNTTTPAFASIAGTKTFASIYEHSTAPVGLMLSGTYGFHAIQANGFTVSPSGYTSVTGLNVGTGTPPSSTSPCNAGDFRFDGAWVYACVAPNTWKRAALSTW